MDRLGWTLTELSTALLLLTLGGGVAVPFLHRQRATLAVHSAARAVEAASFRARQAALLDGGAELVLRAGDSARVWIGPVAGDTLRLEEWGVTLRIRGGASEARVVYGPDGLGRVASRTLTLAHGSRTLDLVFSSYGRVEVR